MKGTNKYDYVQSRVKDQIAYHKRQYIESQNYNHERDPSENKIDTRVYTKGQKPNYNYNEQPRAIHDNIAPAG